MQSAKQQSPVSALHEILTWSATRPDWQRDALRWIIDNGSIEKDDLKELERLCRAKHNADASKDPAVLVEPLAATHLPPAPGAETSVSLVSIGNLNHVNRIPSDQVITFGCAPGLTVIYGDNGSGKSGYARVIKKACRARGTVPIILPNVFVPAVSARASAMIVFRTAGADIPVTWMDGVAPDPRLANVFVFDANSAGH